MILNQIVAVAANLGIGKYNDLLWDYPEDLQFFKEMTSGKIMIMGRKTFDSILKPKGKPLPNRFHIVISHYESKLDFENVRFVKSLSEAYAAAKMLITLRKYSEEVFIVGGAEIYRQSLMDCQKLYITQINKTYQADVFYTPAYLEHFKRESIRESSQYPELSYEVWIKSKAES